MPAAGTRSRETGALQNVGSNGEYFASSSYAAGSCYANIFNSRTANVNPLNTGARGLARSVRCVQHLQAAFSK